MAAPYGNTGTREIGYGRWAMFLPLLTRTYLILFGVVTMTGGAVGYLRARSRASLIAGGVAGLLLMIAGSFIEERSRGGAWLGLVASLALAAKFARPAAKKAPAEEGPTKAESGRGVGPMMTVLAVAGAALSIATLLPR